MKPRHGKKPEASQGDPFADRFTTDDDGLIYMKGKFEMGIGVLKCAEGISHPDQGADLTQSPLEGPLWILASLYRPVGKLPESSQKSLRRPPVQKHLPVPLDQGGHGLHAGDVLPVLFHGVSFGISLYARLAEIADRAAGA